VSAVGGSTLGGVPEDIKAMRKLLRGTGLLLCYDGTFADAVFDYLISVDFRFLLKSGF